MNKLVLGILVSIILLGGIIWLSYPDGGATVNTGGASNSNNNANLALAAEHDSYDFGKISMKDGNVSHIFKIKNTSGKDVEINRLYTSCMCTTAEFKSINGKSVGPFGMLGGHGGSVPYISEVFKAGDEAEVEIVFDPAAHGPAGVGRIERVVVIENKGGSPFQFYISATVTP